MNNTNYNSKIALGFTWQAPASGYKFLKAENVTDAIQFFYKYRAEYISSTLNTIESIPCSIVQAKVIIDGYSVDDLTTKQLRNVENYSLACNFVDKILEDKCFRLNKDFICKVHRIVGKDDSKDYGQFRQQNVRISASSYIPPNYDYLEKMFSEALVYIEEMQDPQEKALCTFLFLSRTQFFNDANKRTASLVTNAILMDAGYYPLIFSFPSTIFLNKMADFYETAKADDIVAYLNDMANKQFEPKQENNSQIIM